MFDPCAHFSWSNIKFLSDSVHITLEKTKTIQCKERNLQFTIPRIQNSSVCLYAQLQALRSQLPPAVGNLPVFFTYLNGTIQPITRQLVDPLFKSALAQAGVNQKSFGWSSFRWGGATHALIVTNDVEALREHGDWKSNAYTRYLALPASKRSHLVSALQKAIS